MDKKNFAILAVLILVSGSALVTSWVQRPSVDFDGSGFPDHPNRQLTAVESQPAVSKKRNLESALRPDRTGDLRSGEEILDLTLDPNQEELPVVASESETLSLDQNTRTARSGLVLGDLSTGLEVVDPRMASRHEIKRPTARPRFDLTISGAAPASVVPESPTTKARTKSIVVTQDEAGMLVAPEANQEFETPVPVGTPVEEPTSETVSAPYGERELKDQGVPIEVPLEPQSDRAKVAPFPAQELPAPGMPSPVQLAPAPLTLTSPTIPSPVHVVPTQTPSWQLSESAWECDGSCLERQPGRWEDPEANFVLGGWLSGGHHTQSNALFNDRPDNFALHQGWLYAEKTATKDKPIGFRVDAMYGIDGSDTQAFGNNPGRFDNENGLDFGAYSWAIPQAYLELQVGDWNIIGGHFFTLIGYEVVGAPDNFFYSHSITMYNSEPFTHTGFLVNRQVGEFDVYAGWTLGWDTGFDQFAGGSSWLGGVSVDLTDSTTLSYFSTAGDFGTRGDDAYSQSLVVDVSITESLNYVFQSDYLRVGSTGEDNVGVNQYLLYEVSNRLAFGSRLEWWKGDVLTSYQPHDAVLSGSGSLSYFAATLGVNIRPVENIVLRPEVRHDWSPAATYSQTYFGIDAVLTF